LEICSHRKIGKQRFQFKVFNTNKLTTRWISTEKLERHANEILQDYKKEHNLNFKKVNLHEQLRRKRVAKLLNKKKNKRLRNQMKVSILKASSDETPKRTLTQDSQDQSDAESSTDYEEVTVVEIMKHKKLKNNNMIFELKFSDGTTDWSDYDCAMIDCEDLLIEYMSKHKIGRQKNMKVAKHTKCKSGVDKKWEKVIKPHRCNESHDWIDLVQETLPGYFKEGARWHGLKCTKCKIAVSERSSEGVFTPSVHKPAYMCTNRSSGCIYLLCNSCYCLEINRADNRRSTRHSDEKGFSNVLI